MFLLFGFTLAVACPDSVPEDLGVNALVLARGNELLRHLEKRIRMEQDLPKSAGSRRLSVTFVRECEKTCRVGPSA